MSGAVVQIDPRRARVLELAASGARPREIAKRVGLSRNTVKGICFRAGYSRTGGQPRREDLARGTDLPQCILDDDKVNAIRSRYERYSRRNGTRALASEYGVTKGAIWKVVSGHSWKHLESSGGITLEWPTIEYPGHDEAARRNQDGAFLAALLRDIQQLRSAA